MTTKAVAAPAMVSMTVTTVLVLRAVLALTLLLVLALGLMASLLVPLLVEWELMGLVATVEIPFRQQPLMSYQTNFSCKSSHNFLFRCWGKWRVLAAGSGVLHTMHGCGGKLMPTVRIWTMQR
jgi:hypothetical protein